MLSIYILLNLIIINFSSTLLLCHVTYLPQWRVVLLSYTSRTASFPSSESVCIEQQTEFHDWGHQHLIQKETNSSRLWISVENIPVSINSLTTVINFHCIIYDSLSSRSRLRVRQQWSPNDTHNHCLHNRVHTLRCLATADKWYMDGNIAMAPPTCLRALSDSCVFGKGDSPLIGVALAAPLVDYFDKTSVNCNYKQSAGEKNQNGTNRSLITRVQCAHCDIELCSMHK